MKLLEGQTVGIDLGTTYSSIAQIGEDGSPLCIENAENKVITPSVVLLADDGKVIVGPTPERISVEKPENVVEAIKREMGNSDFYIVYQNKKLTPEFISALILKKLKQDAEKHCGAITNAVITVPYYFNDVRRKATQDAGRIAGLNVIDIINEPTAATLAYAWEKGELGRPDIFKGSKTILVYDLGGGTFDVTVVKYTATDFRVLATDGDVMLGGLDWTRRIVEHVSEQFQKKHGTNPMEDAESLQVLSQECEKAKRELSSRAQTPVNVYHQGKSLTLSLTRGDFERMTADLMQRTQDTTELVLQQAGIQPSQLDEVVLVGGSTYMPVVKQMLRTVCQREPNGSVVPPEEAVARGASIHAAIMEARLTGGESRMAKAAINRLRSVSTTDVNSHALGVKITDPKDRTRKINHIMIPKNTALPYSITQRFVTTSDNQQRIHVSILQGDAVDPLACEQIGDFRITGLPDNLPKNSPVEVTYSYDAAGRIHVTARELTGNRAASTEIVREKMQTEENIDVMTGLAAGYHVE